MVSVETSKSGLQITGDEEAVAVGRLAQAERTPALPISRRLAQPLPQVR